MEAGVREYGWNGPEKVDNPNGTMGATAVGPEA